MAAAVAVIPTKKGVALAVVYAVIEEGYFKEFSIFPGMDMELSVANCYGRLYVSCVHVKSSNECP
jgi:hypothetical protein